jgi:Asp-tRNA(Asn)/Glu-tRNA(Gln) amidotransferase A subunit family amidase
VPLAFGTQTGGSVIRPAAYCGVVGFKPSFGLINRTGMKIMSDSLDTIGVMARSVADCALFAGAAAGVDLGDPDVKPGRAPRIGLCRSPSWHEALPETEALFDRVTQALARAGANLAACELPEPYARLATVHPIVMCCESARAMGWELAHRRSEISEMLLDRLEFGLAQSTEAVAAAHATFAETQRDFPAVTEGFDVLVTPSAPGQAPEGLHSTGDAAFNFIWTSLHVPCVTVPAGMGPNGLPLGIQIVGRQGEDRATLAWARYVANAVAA